MNILNKFKKNNKINIEESFKKNLKYISSTEIDPNTIEKQFQKSNTRFYLEVGETNIITGNIIVADPLAYLPIKDNNPILNIKIPKGIYKIETSICRSNEIGIRMCTVRLKIKNTKAISYKLASPTEESAIFKGKDGILTGFPVDAGMVTICDEQVAIEYQEFLEEWYKEHPNKNHYNDYFANFFKESSKKLPQYQREEGDFIEWENPKTHNKLVMVASGLGDGFYQSYWGYDQENEICELIVPLVNPDLFGV